MLNGINDKPRSGSISSVRVGYGFKAKNFDCDAVVLCNGHMLSQSLNKLLGWSVPVLPLNQYTLNFDFLKYIHLK